MPELCRFYGIVVRMFFEDHNPPHFHISYQSYDAIVTIKEGLVKGEMPRRALNLVFEWLDLHRDDLMANWELIQSTGEFNKIEPLK